MTDALLDLPLSDADGAPTQLRSKLAAAGLVVVFLRHFG